MTPSSTFTDRVRWPADPRKRWLAAYVAGGFAVNSVLHTWYVAHQYGGGGVRLGVPFLPLGVGVPVAVGYAGALALGVLAAVGTSLWLDALPPLDRLTLRGLLAPDAGGVAVAGSAGLLAASQVLAGASWSKAVLDVVLVVCAAIAVVSYSRPFEFWSVLSLYAAIVSVLLTVGGRWLSFAGRLSFPHFPAFAYFALSAIYALGGSFLYVTRYTLDTRPDQPGDAPVTPGRVVAGVDPDRSVEDLAALRDRLLDADAPADADLLAYFTLAAALAEQHSTALLRDTLAASADSPEEAGRFFETRLDQPRREELLARSGALPADLRSDLRRVRRTRDALVAGTAPPDLDAEVRSAYDAVAALAEAAE